MANQKTKRPKPKGVGGPKALMGPTQRQLRAGELVRHALADILREEDLVDPALTGVSVTITQARMSPDLRHATVFVEPLGAGVVDASSKAAHVAEVVEALNKSAKFLRGRLGPRLETRFTPDLRFRHDESFENAAAIDRLFDDPRVRADLTMFPDPDGTDDGA